MAREGDERATFTTFLQETGSSYKPEDFNKTEARNEMRRHNQIKEVNDLAIQAGKDGIPLLKRLKIKEDGSGYENLVPIKAELQEIIDEKKRKRGQAGKSLSEAEGNALAYSERMRFDNKIMDQAEIDGVSPEKDLVDGFIASYTQNKDFSIGNALLAEGFQSFKVAADNFIRAVLRKESGAAIAESEYIGAFRDYIPLQHLGKESLTQCGRFQEYLGMILSLLMPLFSLRAKSRMISTLIWAIYNRATLLK